MICGQTPDYFRNIALAGDTPTEQAIKQLQQQMRGKEDKEIRILIMADSYGSGLNGANNEHVIPWTEIVVASLNPAWHRIQFLADSGFTAGHKIAIDQMRDIVAEIGETQFGQITDIVFGYGYTERLADIENLSIKMREMNQYISSLNPTCRIHLFPTGWTIDPTERNRLFWLYNNAYASFSASNGWSYYNNTFMAMMSPDCFSPDGAHPSQTGHQRLARSIISCLAGGESIAKEQAVAKAVGDSTPLLHTCCTGQSITITALGNPYNLVDYNFDKFTNSIGYLTNSNIIGGGNINTWVWCKDTSDVYHRANVRIDFNHDGTGTFMSIYNYDDPIQHVKQIYFPSGTYILPADRG